MTASILTLILTLMSFAVLPSDRRSPELSDLIGNWTGTSLCQVKPSACHDESVVFRLSHPQKDRITVQADKIVEGQPVTMGVDDWTYDKPARSLTYKVPRGTWKLTVDADGKTMEGTLTTTDHVVFRKVHLETSP